MKDDLENYKSILMQTEIKRLDFYRRPLDFHTLISLFYSNICYLTEQEFKISLQTKTYLTTYLGFTQKDILEQEFQYSQIISYMYYRKLFKKELFNLYKIFNIEKIDENESLKDLIDFTVLGSHGRYCFLKNYFSKKVKEKQKELNDSQTLQHLQVARDLFGSTKIKMMTDAYYKNLVVLSLTVDEFEISDKEILNAYDRIIILDSNNRRYTTLKPKNQINPLDDNAYDILSDTIKIGDKNYNEKELKEFLKHHLEFFQIKSLETYQEDFRSYLLKEIEKINFYYEKINFFSSQISNFHDIINK